MKKPSQVLGHTYKNKKEYINTPIYMYTSDDYRSSKQKLNHEFLDPETNLKHGKKLKFQNSGRTMFFYKSRTPKFKETMLREHMVKKENLTTLHVCLIF